MHCAVVDDEKVQRDLVQRVLAGAGHDVESFATGRALVNRLRRDTFDCVILDWAMPDMSGIEVLRLIREGQHADLPVIILTSRSADGDIVEGLGAGADDYIVKPFSEEIFLARVHAVTRRLQRGEGALDPVTYGDYRFEPANELAIVRGREVRLTAKEMALTLALFRNLSRPLSRAYLLESIWGQGPDVETRTLDAHVSRIRSKLGLRAENGYRVLPVYSYGYRLEQIRPAAPAATPASGIAARTPAIPASSPAVAGLGS